MTFNQKLDKDTENSNAADEQSDSQQQRRFALKSEIVEKQGANCSKSGDGQGDVRIPAVARVQPCDHCQIQSDSSAAQQKPERSWNFFWKKQRNPGNPEQCTDSDYVERPAACFKKKMI